MNESENNFEPLRRLLALKRYEIPPPGYFDRFSSQVISRLRAGEAGASRAIAEPSWWLRLLQAFEAKPAFAGTFASSLCILLVFGIVYAERPEGIMPNSPVFATVSQPVASLVSATMSGPAPSSQSTGLMINTNPVLSLEPAPSLFGQQNPLVQPINVSFPISGN